MQPLSEMRPGVCLQLLRPILSLNSPCPSVRCCAPQGVFHFESLNAAAVAAGLVDPAIPRVVCKPSHQV